MRTENIEEGAGSQKARGSSLLFRHKGNEGREGGVVVRCGVGEDGEQRLDRRKS